MESLQYFFYSNPTQEKIRGITVENGHSIRIDDVKAFSRFPRLHKTPKRSMTKNNMPKCPLIKLNHFNFCRISKSAFVH
jgi:hypothetical protein